MNEAEAIALEYGPPAPGEFHCMENGKIVLWERSEPQPSEEEIKALVRKHKATIDDNKKPLPSQRQMAMDIERIKSALGL